MYALFALTAVVSTYPVLVNGPIVDLGYTRYKGSALENGITQWLGMRYAAPPLGDLRFRAAQDPIANSTLQIADTVSPPGRNYTRSPLILL